MKYKKKHIVFFGVKYFPSKGGTSRVVENIIRFLVNDYKVTIYCYKHPDAKTNISGVQTIQFPEFPFGAAGVFFYYLLTSIHLFFFQDRKCIIHAHKTDCAFFLPFLKLRFKKIVATSHEAPYHRDKWNVIGKLYFRFMEKIFMSSGTILTSISKPLAEYYEKKYSQKVIFIPNGINADIDYNAESAKEILKKHNVSDPFIMYSARRIMSTKGLHTMLEALYLMNFKGPVVIAGDQGHAIKYVANLKEKYKHLNLKFIGFVELKTLLGLIDLAELFIFPSEIEGMSIMLLEVMTVGTPIICSDIAENKQVFSMDETLYFKNKDALDLMEKIKFAISNKDKMDEFTIKAQQKINECYRWSEITKSYCEIYNT